MGTDYRFEEYIQYLRESFVDFLLYRKLTGTFEENANLAPIKEALFSTDPFIVYNASVAATVVLATDKTMFH